MRSSPPRRPRSSGSDPYAALAADYHWFFDAFGLKVGTRTPGVQATIRDLPDGARILDAACGIGVDTLSLHRRGFRVTATDASRAMVRECQRRLVAEGALVPVLACRWADLPERFGPGFDAVLCLGNSLSHAPSPDARRSALAAFAAVLVPGGTLLLDVQDWVAVHATGSHQDHDPQVVSREGARCTRHYDWRVPERFEDPLVLEITLRIRDDGAERSSTHAFTFGLFTIDDLMADLEATGFVGVDMHQDPGDDRYALVARRPPTGSVLRSAG
ncbi:MAG: methyltransferase domain-containing protein [Acidimicrobiales bacterium]